MKEEILLSYNVGKNSFDFLLETDGLVLTEINGQFVLVNPETEQQVGKLGEIIVFDSAGQIVRGQMTAQTIKNGQIYGVTVSVDQEFLASATYPVAIDPTVYMDPVEEDYEYGETVMIEDVSIYNNINVQGYTFIEWHQIGEVFDTGYQGQAAFRFPILYTPSELYGYSSLTADQIFSFTLHLKSTTNTTETNTLRVCQYVPPWPNTFKIFDTDYFGYFNFTDNDISVIDVPQDSSFCIDLTGFVKQWKDLQHGLINDYYLGSAETGVLLWNDDDSGKIWLESVEYSTSIYVTMDYIYPTDTGDFYMNNKATKTFLAADTDNDTLELRSGRVADIGQAITWNVEYEGGGFYSLHPNGQKDVYLDMWGELTDEKSEETMWTRSFANGGGVTWTCDDGAVLGVDDGEVVVDFPEYFTNEQMAWRVVRTENYVDDIQLNQNCFNTTVNEIVNFSRILSEIPVSFSTVCDFSFSTTAPLSINSQTGLVNAAASGFWEIETCHIPSNQMFTLFLNVECEYVVVPCILNRTVDLSKWVPEFVLSYDEISWVRADNYISAVSENGIVTGLIEGIGEVNVLDDDGNVLCVCLVHVINPLSQFNQDEIDFLLLDGTHLGTISIMYADEKNLNIDSLLIRIEWYIYIVNALDDEKTDDEIRAGLYSEFDLQFADDWLFRQFLATVHLGRVGRFSRENIVIQLDGAKCLLNLLWGKYAAAALASIDMVNRYIPTTEPMSQEEIYQTDRYLQDQKAKEIATKFTNNPDANRVIIGTRYQNVNWNEVGAQTGATYFYSPSYDATAAQYGSGTMTSANMTFLNKQLELGKEIYCAHDPDMYLDFSTGCVKEGAMYAKQYTRELIRLLDYARANGKTIEAEKVVEGIFELWRIIFK